jgi:hypothetical protein
MFVAGHLGLGWSVLRKWSPPKARPEVYWGIFGCIAPDLVDKTLHYSEVLVFGQAELFYGTRMLAHAPLLWLVIGLALAIRPVGSLKLCVMSLIRGALVHIALDHGLEWISGRGLGISGVDLDWSLAAPRVQGLLFPLLGWNFPRPNFEGAIAHLRTFSRPHLVFSEIVGAVACVWIWKDLKRLR